MLMPAVRVAMAQINPTVGDLSGNSAKILQIAKRAQQAGAQIVLFPELALTGYPIEDLALSRDFLNASEQALKDLAKASDKAGLGEMTLVVGYPGFAVNPSSWAIGANKAALISAGPRPTHH
jgi:NAD+ synthase (glutamine-hydrolysing)